MLVGSAKSMLWYALTHVGAEKALSNELQWLGVKARVLPGACAFEADHKTAATVLSRSQVTTRLLLGVAEGPFEALELKKAHEVLPEEETFKAECEVVAGGPDLPSTVAAAKLGEQIDRPVDLTAPKHVLFCQLGPIAVCGVDVSGDLSRRYYRVFTNRRSVKGTFAASLLWAFPTKGAVLDPLANTGEVAIEAALRSSGVSALRFARQIPLDVLTRDDLVLASKGSGEGVWCFDPQLGNLRSCKKNAKLASVDKHIGFSKLEPDWMDIKLDKGSVGAVITIPPPVTQRDPDDTTVRELCYQAPYVLSKDGLLIVACLTPETGQALAVYAKKYKLSFRGEVVVQMGQLPVQVMAFGL
jgi:23S rRNA G2445 N2-methylase RlmL